MPTILHFDYPCLQAILQAICFKSQMGCSSGYFESALGPLLPGLVCSIAVVDFSPSPAVLQCLSCPPLHLFFFSGRPYLLWNGIKGSDSHTFTPVISIPNPPRLRLLAHTNDAELWAPTHRTVCRSHCQILPGILFRRGSTGEYVGVVCIFLVFQKNEKTL